MRILITGGAGFIGSHLVDRLVRDRLGEVIVLDNLRRGDKANLSRSCDHIQFVEGDIGDQYLLRDVMERVNVVYHLAAQSNVIEAERDPEYCHTTNVDGTLRVLSAAKAAGVERFVFTSSREVYGDPDALPVPESARLRPKNVYGSSKVAAETHCRVFRYNGLAPAILRLANVYGPRDVGRVIPLFLECVLREKSLTVYGGGQVLDFVWIDTVVQCLVRAGCFRAIHAPVNVGSGKGTTILQLAHRMMSIVGAKNRIKVLAARECDVSSFVADTRRMEKEFDLHSAADPLSDLKILVECARSHIVALENVRANSRKGTFSLGQNAGD